MLYIILIILYLIVFALLAWKKMNWAILVVVFALPSYLIRFKVGLLPMTVLEGMILIIFLIFTITKLKYKNTRLPSASPQVNGGQVKTLNQKLGTDLFLFSCIFIFLVSATMAIFVGPDLRAALGIWKAYFIEPILFFIVFVSVIKKEDFKNIFWALAGSSLVVSGVAIYQKLTGNLITNDFWAAEATRRVSGVFPYPNALALYIGPIVVLLMGWLVILISGTSDKNQKNKKTGTQEYIKIIILGLIIIISLLAAYWSGSKGAIMGIAAGIFFYALFWAGKRKYFWPVVIIGILMSVWLWQSGKINLKGNYSVEGGDSISVRQEMWTESWQMLKDRPVLGAGLGGYQMAMQEYHEKKYIEIYLYSHNIFLNFWSETGILGLVAFILISAWFYKAGLARRMKDSRFLPGADKYDLRIILMAAMAVIIVHGLVDVPYFKNDLSVFFWILIGMMRIEDIRQK